MKKIYIIVLSAITVMCIVVGTIAHVGGWFNFFSFGIGSGELLEYAEEQPAFSSLRVEADVLSITVQRGDGYYIQYKASERLAPKIEHKGDTLVVTQSAQGFSLFSWGNKCEMILTVPDGVQLSNAEFDMDVGNLVLSNLLVDYVKVTTDVGNVEMTSCAGSRLEAESDVGNIDIRASDFINTNIEADVGNVYFSTRGELSQYAIALATDVGKVIVNGNSYKRHFNQTAPSTSDVCRLTIETDTGNIEIATEQ